MIVMHIIKKVLNSSVVLVHDEKNKEFILLGKGIGYGKKAGEKIQPSSDNQVFVPVGDVNTIQYLNTLETMSLSILQVTKQIIVHAEQLMQTTFSNNLYFVLADHLQFAIERMKQNIVITNRVYWEIKTYYPEEFRAGLIGLSLIEEEMGIRLPDEEAANIAFHLANTRSDSDGDYDSIKYAKVIAEINNIVIFGINRTLDKQSIHYIRFVTHIKFFVERYFTGKLLSGEDDTLYQRMKMMNPKEFSIALHIKEFLENKYHIIVGKQAKIGKGIYMPHPQNSSYCTCC